MSNASIVVVWLLCVGCGKSENKNKPAPQQPPTAEATAGDCAKRGELLSTELRELAKTKPGFLPIVQGINAPSTKGAQPIQERGWVLAVTRDGGIFIQGHRFEKTEHTTVIEDVRNYTDSMFKNALEKHVMGGGSGRDLSVPLYIWADRDAPARVIAELVAFANPEGPWPPRPAGAKDKPSSGDDPPPPMVDDPPPLEEDDEDMQAARKEAIEQARKAGILGKPGDDPRPPRVPMRLLVATDGKPAGTTSLPATEPESTTKLVEQLKTAVGDCAAIITTMGTSSLEGLPMKEAEKLATDIPAGLVSCGCKPDVDALATGMRTWFGAWAPALSWIEMPAIDAKDTRTIGQLLAP